MGRGIGALQRRGCGMRWIGAWGWTSASYILLHLIRELCEAIRVIWAWMDAAGLARCPCVMEAHMKKQINVVATATAPAGSVTFTFDGGLPSVTFDSAKASEACRNYAMLHGFNARIGDNAALVRKQPDGTVIAVTEEMRRNAVLELVEHYESGSVEWNTRARTARPDAAIQAIMTKRGCSAEEAFAWLNERLMAEFA